MTRSPACNLFAIALLGSGIAGCPTAAPESAEPKTDASPLRICASIPPVAFAVKAIGGDRVSVSTLLLPGQSPATYEPTSKQMVELSKTQCLFAVGVPFEAQVVASVSSSMPDLRIVDVSVGLETRQAEFKCDHSHEEGHDHAHHHASDIDPHVWMNPRLMIAIAESVHVELSLLSPSDTPLFDANMNALKRTLEILDAEIRAMLAPLATRSFYVYHPSLGYFADAYGLKQEAIEQGGKAPTAKELDALVKRARSENAKLIFVQPQFSQRAAHSVAEQINGSVVTLDPLSENYVENLRTIAEGIKDALGGSSVPDDGTNEATND
ncbi:MAG: ABC transporter substrate-binding protein [Phycisphaerae bacterium]|nr:MAG: ABC transporter substrate-binding protein [Phycisphaerae bacterium]